MGLRLPDAWIWDFWFAEDGDEIHVFYLQAPRSLGDPHLRHRNARFGHAVSRDLRSWTVLPDPLPPAVPGSWDDLATWTGSIIRRDGTWYLFYTGCSRADDGLVQRIGLATSRDLNHFERYGDEPLIEADPRWYELLDQKLWHDQAWRDPWVYADTDGDGYHALITARRKSGPADARGVIGHAVSADLLHWQVRPPLVSPAGFGQLEVPQVTADGDSTLLTFCTGAEHVAASRLAHQDRPARTGSYICRGPGPLGPFDVPVTTEFLPYSPLYAGKLVRHAGTLWFMGFVNEIDGEFVGELADPVVFDAARAVPQRVAANVSDPR